MRLRLGARLRHFRRLLVWLFAAAQAGIALTLTASALSQTLAPQAHPSVSYWGMAFPVLLALDILSAAAALFVRRKLVLIPLAGLLANAAAVRTYCPVNLPTAVPDTALHVLSYNVYNLAGTVRHPAEDNPIANYILRQRADIVCCQESAPMREADIDTLLAAAYPYRQSVTLRKTTLTLLSRLPVVSVDSVAYTSGSNASVCFRLRWGADTLLLINNHLESYHLTEDERAEYKAMIRQPADSTVAQGLRALLPKIARSTATRGAQADSIAAYAERARERHIIVVGDFNDTPISYVHHRLTRHLDDAYTRAGLGPGISYNRSGMYFRIDNVLISPTLRAHRARVDRSIAASDHYPIHAWLTKR